MRLAVIGAIVLYSCIRFIPVNTFFGTYGVNPWVFLTIDVATAAPYIMGLEHLALAIKDKTSFRRQLLWFGIAAGSFMAPYIYIYAASHHLPEGFAIGLGIIILLFAGNGVAQVYRRIRGDD